MTRRIKGKPQTLGDKDLSGFVYATHKNTLHSLILVGFKNKGFIFSKSFFIMTLTLFSYKNS